MIHVSNDQLEGTLYRTQVFESQINIVFQSRVLFDMFLKKMHSDLRQSVEKDETTFVSKCSTPFKGVKCNLKLDSHFKTVELSGIGFRLWREERFPKVAQSLFRRLTEEVDSQLEEPALESRHRMICLLVVFNKTYHTQGTRRASPA